jgi:hypothetical protein
MGIRSSAESLLTLMATRSCVLHAPDGADPFGGGQDVDCAVIDPDANWPLRLNDHWRLCQVLQYDVTGRHWVLERNGETIALDTLTDPRGLGRYGLPTGLIFDGQDHPPSPGVRAAYLTIKRLRKGIQAATEWARVTGLACQDPDTYRNALATMLGLGVAQPLAGTVLSGWVPDASMTKRALRALFRRRCRTPARVAIMAALGARRWLQRMTHPTGLVVLVAGPDGTGKSTLAARLMTEAAELFRREARVHWRPGLLPRPGILLGREAADPSQPHGRARHGRAMSLVLVGYYWLDFVAGSWLKIWPTRLRTGMVIMERGWWDLAVDPRRYRLDIPPWLIRALGALIPRPDLALVLEAPADVLAARKAELPAAELDRQMFAWRDALPTAVRSTTLDAAEPVVTVAAHAREAVVTVLESRTAARIGAGWAGLPRRLEPRWWLPRGPAPVARRSLEMYQPVTGRAKVGWTITRLLAGLGGLRLASRAPAPPREIRELLAPRLPRGATVAVTRANHAGRFIALVISADATPLAVAKIALTSSGRSALSRERHAVERLGRFLPAPLAAPQVLDHDDGLLLLEAIAWRPRPRPWDLPMEVAVALGEFFRGDGASHGDFAPWNLLRGPDAWVLIDWEDAHVGGEPFADLFHYFVQGHTLLGRPSASEVLAGAAGQGATGAVVRAYADAAGLDPADAPAALAAYLDASFTRLDRALTSPHVVEARRRLRAALS